MRVLVDTNIFCTDYRLSGTAFRVFLEAITRLGLTCCVPEIVRDELLAVHRRAMEEAAASIQKAERAWLQLTGVKPKTAIAPTDIDSLAREYSRFIDEQFSRAGARVLPYPDVPHRALVQRATSRRRPFNESGSGYRDALIWATLLSLLESEPGPVAFVTNNTRDFGVTPALHPDLSADLPAGRTVDLFNSLGQFNAARIVPHLEHLDTVLRQLEANAHPQFSLHAWVERELCDLLNVSEDGAHFVGLDPTHCHARACALKSISNVAVDDVRLLPSHDLLVLANVDVTVEVSVSADSNDCERDRHVREFFDSDCGDGATIWVDETGNVAFTLTLAGPTLEVETAELDEVDAAARIEINPHPRRVV